MKRNSGRLSDFHSPEFRLPAGDVLLRTIDFNRIASLDSQRSGLETDVRALGHSSFLPYTEHTSANGTLATSALTVDKTPLALD
jgi:hypothetical protein